MTTCHNCGAVNNVIHIFPTGWHCAECKMSLNVKEIPLYLHKEWMVVAR